MLRTILYCVCVPLSLLALDSINITNIFKKNRYYQSRLLYLMLALGLSYLTVNFFMDFFISSKFI